MSALTLDDAYGMDSSPLRLVLSRRSTYPRLVSTDPAEEEYEVALAKLRAAHEAVLDAIETLADPHRAYVLAGEASELLLEMRGKAAHVRAHQVERIWEAEKTTLAELAVLIGTNKARAGQFLKEAREDTGRGRS
jgi:hypothetical protein